MKLKHGFILYLVILHLIFIIPSFFLIRNNQWLLLAVEGFYLVSFLCGLALIRALFHPLDLITSGTELIEEEDFTSTFRITGHREMDRVRALFNSMLIQLREERVKTEEQHFFLQKLLDAIPCGIVILDYDGRVESANPCVEKLLELPCGSMRGLKPSELPAPIMTAIDALPVDGSAILPFRGSRRLKCAKAQFITRGFPQNFLLLEEMTDEIKESEKNAFEKLIRIMSHEVNNSVGAVGSLLHSCRKYTGQIDEADREDFRTVLDVSISRMKNLDEFMRNYADIVRISPPVFRDTDIVQLLERCRSLFRKECGEKNIRWNHDFPDSIPFVRCDLIQMEQAFMNVFKNAVEAIGSDGDVNVSARIREAVLTITIEDTGCGISEHVRDNLFTPFFSTKKTGQGIGLMLVREIFEKHGFTYSLDGKPEGTSLFTLRIPL